MRSLSSQASTNLVVLAMIHGEICEVFSRQGILIKGTPVRVVDIRPFDLVVVKDDSPSGD